MARVLLGDFGTIVRLGLGEVLEEEGVQLVGEEMSSHNVVDRLIATLPDVVVLDMDDRSGGLDLARRIAREYPAIKVIACSSREPRMRVFPPFHRGESYDEHLLPERFVRAIKE